MNQLALRHRPQRQRIDDHTWNQLSQNLQQAGFKIDQGSKRGMSSYILAERPLPDLPKVDRVTLDICVYIDTPSGVVICLYLANDPEPLIMHRNISDLPSTLDLEWVLSNFNRSLTT